MQRISWAVRVVAIAVVAASATLFVATPALATVTDCTTRAVDYEVFTVCASGSGRYQTFTWCDAPWYTLNYIRKGEVSRPGYYSWAVCNTGDAPYNFGYFRWE
jgi:hypothetical protein